MSSTLRRLSASLPFSSSNAQNTDDSSSSSSLFRRKSSVASVDNDPNFRSLGARDYKLAMNVDDSESSSSPSRRKSSTAFSSADNDSNFRSLGARDYKLAMDPEEEKGRRSSIADYVADMAARQDAAQGDEEAAVVRKGSVSRIYGARDWRLVGKE